jgi:hypothetical protein
MFLRLRGFVCAIVLVVLPFCVWAQEDGTNLGDYARQLREKKTAEPPSTTGIDAKGLFAEMDAILDFASADTGYPKRSPVQRKLLSRSQLDGMYLAAWNNAQGIEGRILNAELVLKKFGLLPAEFELSSFLRTNVTKRISGLYRPDDKTMYLMNWVPLEQQRPIMAHELTHALQDQSFDLTRFMAPETVPSRSLRVTELDASERSETRRAIVEGQATLVLLDYELQQAFAGRGRTLDAATYAHAMEFMQTRLQDYESPVSFRNAPLIFSATTEFPYREGLAFELQAVRIGRRAAFAGMFDRPPRSTYEILEPDAYFAGKKPPVVPIPDLSSVLKDNYEPYDNGAMGEFDIYMFAKEFGRDNDIYSVAQKWNGGSYVIARRRSPDPRAKITTNDLALLYISRWRTPGAARRFVDLYRKALAKHVTITKEVLYETQCEEDAENCKGLSWGVHLDTSEGPASLEIWPGNTLLISQSFEDATLAQLRPLALAAPAQNLATSSGHELHMKLYEIPDFVALQERFGQDWLMNLLQSPAN